MNQNEPTFISGARPALTWTQHEVSVRGQRQPLPALAMGDAVLIVRGGILRVAEIFDEYWIERDRLPDPREVVRHLQQVERCPDLFTFTERVPETEPRFDFPRSSENVAAVPISSHEHWMRQQISAASRRNIRTSEKKGVSVRASAFDEAYIRGIMAISDESPTRAGRAYWHYGKDFKTVKAEQGTYAERSTYLGAYLGDEMIGYLKLVWDRQSAAIMQIVSKLEHLDKRPNNALLSEAVRLCAERQVAHLLYERFVYGKKADSSLTRFKRENGFIRVDLSCYHVPLTARGRLALALGVHRSVKERLPYWLTKRLVDWRAKWYSRTLPVAP